VVYPHSSRERNTWEKGIWMVIYHTLISQKHDSPLKWHFNLTVNELLCQTCTSILQNLNYIDIVRGRLGFVGNNIICQIKIAKFAAKNAETGWLPRYQVSKWKNKQDQQILKQSANCTVKSRRQFSKTSLSSLEVTKYWHILLAAINKMNSMS
jgi:hypothetical protein